MNNTVLEFRGVSATYEKGLKPAISGISFKVGAGERVALIGLNGSGKTTVLMAAAGLVPHTGDIEVCGDMLCGKTLGGIRDRIGFLFNVPEDQLLFPEVYDDVSFSLKRQGVPSNEVRARTMKVLEQLGIAHLADSPVHHLSHGQKQRVALAGALAAEPPLLLLDEPTSALDPPGREHLADLLSAVPSAMLVATHDTAFARRLCSRYLFVNDGQITLETPCHGTILFGG
ncbi:MAG: ABC transporter ATP-binding protein [Myxococcota bacterium]|jgi:energy-coupling factor transporter ATP-binding protein EcfA2